MGLESSWTTKVGTAPTVTEPITLPSKRILYLSAGKFDPDMFMLVVLGGPLFGLRVMVGSGRSKIAVTFWST